MLDPIAEGTAHISEQVNPPRAHSSLKTAAKRSSVCKQGDIQWLNSQSLGLGFSVLAL